VAKVTAVGQNGWSLLVNPQPISVTDYADLTGIPLDESAMTRITTYPQSVSGSREEEAAPPEETLPTEETVPQEESMPAEDPLPPEESVPVDQPLPPEETQPSQDVPPQQEQPPQEEPVVMAPVYERVNGSWQQISSAAVSEVWPVSSAAVSAVCPRSSGDSDARTVPGTAPTTSRPDRNMAASRFVSPFTFFMIFPPLYTCQCGYRKSAHKPD
jgi:outer membrane biosynthesis protein TonB